MKAYTHTQSHGFTDGIDARTVPYAALVLRVGLGLVSLAHALLKAVIFGLPGAAAFFVQHGFPGWTVYPVFAVELIAAILLFAGLYTRVAAAALLPVLAGAFLVHWPNGWSFTAPGGGWEYIAFLIFATLAQVLLGDGAFAASAVLKGRDAHQPQAGRAHA